MFADPDKSTKGVGRLSRILPIPFVVKSVISGYANTGKKFSIAFIINFPKKNAELFVMALIKREVLTVAKSCT